MLLPPLRLRVGVDGVVGGEAVGLGHEDLQRRCARLLERFCEDVDVRPRLHTDRLAALVVAPESEVVLDWQYETSRTTNNRMSEVAGGYLMGDRLATLLQLGLERSKGWLLSYFVRSNLLPQLAVAEASRRLGLVRFCCLRRRSTACSSAGCSSIRTDDIVTVHRRRVAHLRHRCGREGVICEMRTLHLTQELQVLEAPGRDACGRADLRQESRLPRLVLLDVDGLVQIGLQFGGCQSVVREHALVNRNKIMIN